MRAVWAIIPVWLCAASAARADWTAIPLTPSGMWDSAVYAVTPTQQFGRARLPNPPYTFQAMVWNGSSTAWSSLNPPGAGAILYGAGDSSQVGASGTHAAVWYGTSPSFVDLHPLGMDLSEARATDGTHQYGWVRITSTEQPKAAMWTGSPSSYLSLHPVGMIGSQVICAAQSGQGGGVYTGGWFRAGLWSGTPQSFVNLHPSGCSESAVLAMTDDHQVGFARPTGQFKQAAMWRGTAQSYQNLDPGVGYSELRGTCGPAQVGYIAPVEGVFAGIWFGTAESFHNLAQYLPPGYAESYATSIATDGVNYYVGGYAVSAATFRTEAFLWIGPVGQSCYPNCDNSTVAPILNVADFTCFLQRFATGDTYTNCDNSTAVPTLNIADFTCFLQRFAAGCP